MHRLRSVAATTAGCCIGVLRDALAGCDSSSPGSRCAHQAANLGTSWGMCWSGKSTFALRRKISSLTGNSRQATVARAAARMRTLCRQTVHGGQDLGWSITGNVVLTDTSSIPSSPRLQFFSSVKAYSMQDSNRHATSLRRFGKAGAVSAWIAPRRLRI